jgi:hypothetical protein
MLIKHTNGSSQREESGMAVAFFHQRELSGHPFAVVRELTEEDTSCYNPFSTQSRTNPSRRRNRAVHGAARRTGGGYPWNRPRETAQ